MTISIRHAPATGIVPRFRLWFALVILAISFLFFPRPVAAETYYSIRLASFRDKNEAAKKMDELRKLGHHAFMKTVNLGPKGTWHRVYIERYSTRAEAESEARIFHKLDLISGYGIDPIFEQDRTSVRPTTHKLFFLHVFSFQSQENADKATDRLKEEGYKAFSVREEIRAKTWYRVYVGEFSSESSARRAGSAMKQRGLIPYFKPLSIHPGLTQSGKE
jgi:cell division septation protein DedD